MHCHAKNMFIVYTVIMTNAVDKCIVRRDIYSISLRQRCFLSFVLWFRQRGSIILLISNVQLINSLFIIRTKVIIYLIQFNYCSIIFSLILFNFGFPYGIIIWYKKV